MQSNVDRSECFTFVKKKAYIEEMPRVGEFLSTNATLPNVSSNTTRKFNRPFEDITLSRDKSSDSNIEEDNVAVNYYRQTVYSKGMLGLLHFRQRILQLEGISEEYMITKTYKGLNLFLKEWRSKMSTLYTYNK